MLRSKAEAIYNFFDMTPDVLNAETSVAATSDQSIVFFDGVCGLCNSFVDFAMPRDKRQRLVFAPLQGETAEQLLSEDQRNLDTVVLRSSNGVFTHSSAIVRVLWSVGGVWSVCGTLLWLVPKPIRDLGYRVFASQRYRLFGKKETCRLPTPEEAGRILP